MNALVSLPTGLELLGVCLLLFGALLLLVREEMRRPLTAAEKRERDGELSHDLWADFKHAQQCAELNERLHDLHSFQTRHAAEHVFENRRAS